MDALFEEWLRNWKGYVKSRRRRCALCRCVGDFVSLLSSAYLSCRYCSFTWVAICAVNLTVARPAAPSTNGNELRRRS